MKRFKIWDKPDTFYNWVKWLRQKGCMDLPVSTGRSYSDSESQEVVRVDFHDTDVLSYKQPPNMVPASAKRNNFSTTKPMSLSIGSFLLTISNGTDPQFLAQTLLIIRVNSVSRNWICHESYEVIK